MTGTGDCPAAFIELAGRLADAAGDITRRYFRSGVAVDDKPDSTPVTIADRGAEARLREMIAAACPDHGVVGEEYGSDRPDAAYVWVLDPIDGTKAFITGNPLYGTLIALLRDGRPILGVIDMPVLGERWTGAAGRPTLFRSAGPNAVGGETPARVRACPDLGHAVLRCTTPAMFRGEAAAAFARLSAATRLTLYGGDCFSYGQLANGWVDLVVEADLGTYDYMALVPVVTGAGGLATDWQGRPLGLESDGRVVFAGDAALHRASLALLA